MLESTIVFLLLILKLIDFIVDVLVCAAIIYIIGWYVLRAYDENWLGIRRKK